MGGKLELPNAVASHVHPYQRSPFDPFPAERTSQPRVFFSSDRTGSAQVSLIPRASVRRKLDGTRST